ncbi:hypothetical protein GQ44DRAFT_757214 [Phaeosphaeriaceae sp. PMI808]|nr:hypothetical protein GQ44DRAFT_757214 [Phaeosphaeriaceae sp. PMI808]
MASITNISYKLVVLQSCKACRSRSWPVGNSKGSEPQVMAANAPATPSGTTKAGQVDGHMFTHLVVLEVAGYQGLVNSAIGRIGNAWSSRLHEQHIIDDQGDSRAHMRVARSSATSITASELPPYYPQDRTGSSEKTREIQVEDASNGGTAAFGGSGHLSYRASSQAYLPASCPQHVSMTAATGSSVLSASQPCRAEAKHEHTWRIVQRIDGMQYAHSGLMGHVCRKMRKILDGVAKFGNAVGSSQASYIPDWRQAAATD